MKRKIFFVAAVLCYSTLQAQEDPISNLEGVTVTATRFPKKISETGKVVNIISREELSRQGGKDLSQILGEQPGIIVGGATSNPGKDKAVYLQGANYGYTVVLLNGVPVVDPTGVGGAFDLRMIPVDQIERIEILKGAQSTLYGSDAIAGVINIITRKGADAAANFSGGISYGSNKTTRANAVLGGSFNGSSYNVGFSHQETAGISEATDTLHKNIRNGLLNNAVSMDVNGKIRDGFYIKPFFRYSYYNGSIPDEAFQPAKNPYHASLLNTGSQAVYYFKGGSLTGIYSYDEVKRDYSFSYGNFNYAGNKKTTEVFSNYDISDHLQALAGFRYDQLLMKKPKPGTADTSVGLASPFLSFFLKNLGGFNLELGGRLNHHSKYGNNFTYSINPSYLIREKIKLFVNIGTAFRAPALSELFGQWGANPGLKPERSRSFETGMALQLSEKADARFVFFNRRIKDVIASNSFTKYIYTNYNEQKDHGLDVETNLKLNEAVSLKIFYSFVDGKVNFNTGTRDTTYNNLLRRPKHSMGANLGYQVHPRFFVSTNLHYFGKRQDVFFNPSSFSSESKELEAYTLWDVYAEYRLAKNKLKFFGQVSNILDAKYEEVYGYATLEREFSVGLRFTL